MKRIFYMLAMSLLISGCATSKITQNIPKDSKFAQVKLDMTLDEVERILGPPTDVKTETTGNEWIPVYNMLPSDVYECTYYYKGQGNIVFTSRESMPIMRGKSADVMAALFVRKINYDPTEYGYSSGD